MWFQPGSDDWRCEIWINWSTPWFSWKNSLDHVFSDIRLAVTSSNISCGLNILSIGEFYISCHVRFCVFVALHSCALENYLYLQSVDKCHCDWQHKASTILEALQIQKWKATFQRFLCFSVSQLRTQPLVCSCRMRARLRGKRFISAPPPPSWLRRLRMAAHSIVAEANSFRLAAPLYHCSPEQWCWHTHK